MNPDEAGVEYAVFEPQTATPDLWTRFHAYRRARHMESRPEDPILPDAEAEAQLRVPEAFGIVQRYLALAEGQVVGMFFASWMTPDNPGYESNREFIHAYGSVLEPHRRKGIGTEWARRALAAMGESGATILTTWTTEADGRAFLDWLGAEAKMSSAENRLDLREVDWDMVARWAADGAQRNADVTLQFYEHRIPVEMFEEHAVAISSLLNTMPFEDLAHGDIVINADLMAEFHKQLDATGSSLHTYLTREPDGTISGITDVRYTPALPDRVAQMFTGVRPDCRGRGLGKWIKAAMLLYLRSAYPEAVWMTTGNANSNAPMLGINKKLGFKPFRQETGYQIDRDALAALLQRESTG